MYATPTVAVPGSVHVNDNPALTTTLVTADVAVAEAKSATFPVTDDVPVTVGVPVTAPVDGEMLIQLGAPFNEYVYGVFPPLALQLPAYATPTVAVPGKLHVNDNAALTTTFVAAAEAVPDAASVTLPVTDDVPVAVAPGVPVTAPVVVEILIQLGFPLNEYVYGAVPPLALQLPV